MVTVILFDLDGTLLPMDQDEFVKGYFGLLSKCFLPRGYEPKKLMNTVWKGTDAMIRNDGKRSNEEAFWTCFAQVYGEDSLKDKPLFEEFYRDEFPRARKYCSFNPMAADVVKILKESGFRVGLATNPIFPQVATHCRIRWTGLQPEDFELCTTYENIGYCKPNPEYFKEVAARMRVAPEECLMVGNDATEDLAARHTGMNVFLLTDCLINREHKDISHCQSGNFEDLLHYVKENFENKIQI